MAFSSDRRKAATLVALVFVLGIAFGVAGVLAGRRLLGVGARDRGNGGGNSGQQTGQLVRTLGLTAEQERQFRQVLADTRSRYDTIRNAMEPQFRQVRAQNRERIRQILTDEQKPLFNAFMDQSRNRRNGNSSGRNGSQNRNNGAPLLTRLTQELHLTPQQQTQLSGILSDTRASLSTLREQMNPQFEEARQQNRQQLREIVTPEQRPGLDAFFQRRDEERRRR